MHTLFPRPLRLAVLAPAVVAVLAACGGGGSSPSSPAQAMGAMNVQVTDAPTRDFDHVWVTISEVDFHTSNAASPNDPGWLKYPVPATPVDLAALTNGSLAAVLPTTQLPVGTYQQIRLQLLSDTDPLASAAQSAGLAFNDQVNWTDAAGAAHVSPLQIPAARDGITLVGSFAVSATAQANLVIDFDVGADVVKFAHGSANSYLLKPLLHYFDLGQAGGIAGNVDTTHLCTALSSASPVNCAYNLVVKAEEMSADGTHHAVVRATTVRPDGSFLLYPVPIPPGSTSVNVDVLIRGRNMDTILVRNVSMGPWAPGGAAGTSTAPVSLNPTTAPIPLVIDAEYTANASPGLNPTGAWVNFFQTVPGNGEVPYEVRFRHANPFTGTFTDSIELSAGPLQVMSYVAGAAPNPQPVVPAELDGGFQAFAGARYFARTAASSGNVVPPAQGAAQPVLFTIPAMAVDSTVASADSISGTITQATAGKYDQGFLLVVHRGAIVDTIPLAATLAANGGTGGAYSIANMPGGSSTKALPDAYYRLTGWVWKSTDPALSVTRVDFGTLVDLRTGSAAGINATLN